MTQDYVAVQYDLTRRPITDYPTKLAKHLSTIHNISVGSKLLEVGAGRPDVLLGFRAAGMQVYGCDISEVSEKHARRREFPFSLSILKRTSCPIKIIHLMLFIQRA